MVADCSELLEAIAALGIPLKNFRHCCSSSYRDSSHRCRRKGFRLGIVHSHKDCIHKGNTHMDNTIEDCVLDRFVPR